MKFLIRVLALLIFFQESSLHAASTETKKEIALVQLSFDGINTFHCGVGTVIKQTQAILDELNREYQDSVHFKLYLLTGDYSTHLPEYSVETLKQNIDVCERSGGKVYLIPIRKKDIMFGDPEQWKELCQEGAKLCSKIINDNPYTIVLAHDTAFAQIPLELQKLSSSKLINKPYQALWIPHSTSWNYNGHTIDGIANWPERHQWELKAFQEASRCNYKIGVICQTIKEDVLSAPFNVPESAMMFYRTGIVLDKYKNSLDENFVAKVLKEKSIPLDKKLIFSVGRANPLKGLDITLEMYCHLKKLYSDIHLVLLAPVSDYMPSYQEMLKTRIKNEQLEVSLIDEFDPDLAHVIYQWPKTTIISLLSRMDTQPLTVMEARVNPKNSIILVSDPERIGKQVCHGKNGFSCSLQNLEAVFEKPSVLTESLMQVVHCAQQILELSDEERKKIIDHGKRLISEEYDFRKNMIKNLKNLIKIEDKNFTFEQKGSYEDRNSTVF